MSPSDTDLHGVLVIDKPKGPTSHDVVLRVRRRLGVRKAGHTGTLDPMATGVLPVVVGEATKLVPLLMEGDKAYEAEATLGIETDTLDAEGRVVATTPAAAWPTDRAAVERAVADLAGRRVQRPPAFSAAKVGGRPLHERARAGEAAEGAPREVVVHEAALTGFEPAEGDRPPRVRFRVTCSKGTYVRVLAADLGRALGSGAHLSALRRTRSGPFGLERAVPLEALDSEAGRARALAALVPPEVAIGHIPAVSLGAAEAARLAHGQAVPLPADQSSAHLSIGTLVRVSGPGRPLLALAEVRPGPGGRPVLSPTRVFAHADGRNPPTRRGFTRGGRSGTRER
ncbi:MAG TPA: tRNA pseudouridine(55) synthase TruB [Thermodesulfobacteriota bacterium]